MGPGLFPGPANRREKAKRNRHHNSYSRRVADPHGQDGGGESHGPEHPKRAGREPFSRQQPNGKPPVQPVNHKGFGQKEAADKEEDDRMGKRCQHFLCRPQPHGNTQRRPDQ